MPLFRLLALCLIFSVPAVAQRPGQNPYGTALTHLQLNSADPDAATAFWTNVIGTASYNHDSAKGVSTLGALFLFTPHAPSGPTAGSAIDHIGFHVPDLQPFLDRLAKTAYRSFTPAGNRDVLMIDGPDGVRIELTADSSMYAPLEFSHIHLHTAAPKETQAWYGTYFGARTGPDDDADTSRLAGGTLIFTSADTVAPTSGRAIDHLSFDVRDMAGLCTKLTAGGVKFDPPLDPVKASPVLFTDPWGTRIELRALKAQ